MPDRSALERPSQAVHFDRVAAEYDETIAPYVMAHLRGRRLALARSLAASGRVLDVGCGTGAFLAELMQGPYECVGVDPSAEMLEKARERGVPVVQAGGEALPFDSQSFDLVVSFACLHHMIEPAIVAAALREIVRVTRPGGAVLVWDHNPLNPYWRILMARLPQDRGDERLVPAREIVEGLRAGGLSDPYLRRMTFMPDFTPARAVPAVARVERVLERIPGVRLVAAHNVVTGRRPLS